MNLSVLPKSRLKKAFSNVISAFIPFRRARKRVRDILFFGLIKYIKAKRAEANSNFENFLSICAIAKDEGCYFKEWIEYHRLVGVEKFYIYDNNSTDNTREVLEPYVKEGIADYISFPGEKMQLPAYRDAICKFKDKTKYMAFIDLDEFIVPPENKTIADFLRQMEKSKVQTLSPIHRQKEFLKCGGDSDGFSIAGGVCNSESEIILNKERGKTSVCSSEERETLKMQGAIEKTEKDETTAFARPFLKGVTKTSAIAQPLNSKIFARMGEIEFLKCGGDRGGIKTASETGKSESEIILNKERGKTSVCSSEERETLKMQGDSGAFQEVKSGAATQFLSLSKAFKTRLFKCVRPLLVREGIGERYKDVRRDNLTPLNSKNPLPSTQQSDSADRAGRLNKKEQNRQRLAARFCDTLISKISARKIKKTATNAAPEIFECGGGDAGDFPTYSTALQFNF